VSSCKLLVCVGPRCDAEGRGRALLAEVEAAVKKTFADELASGRLAITTRDCLRLCTREPVMRIEPSGDAISDPDIDDLMQTLRVALPPAGKTDGA